MRLEPSRLVWPVAVSVLCLAPAAGAQTDRPLVEGMSQRLTVACGREGAKVQGTGNTVTLTGACTTVLVEGSNNTVHIASLGRLTVAGMNNKVYWTAGIDGAEPKITKEGIGNTVEHKTPADSPAPSASTKPAASGSGAGAGAGSGAGAGAGAGPAVSASSPRGTATATTGGGTPSVTASGQRGTATATTGGGTPSVTATGQRGTATATTGGGTPSVDVASSSGKKVTMSTGGEAGPTVSAGTSGTGAASSRPARASATAPASMGTGTPIVVANNQQVKTMDCEGRAVSVSGNGNRLTLKGLCGPISVGGNENILDVGSTTRIDTSGNRNVVRYRELVNDKAPTVTGGGTGNRVSKVEPQ